MRRIPIGLAAVAVLAVAVAASAHAAVYEKYRFADEWSLTTEECGFPVEVAGSSTGTFVLREGKNKLDGVFPYLFQYKFSERWTNPETGEWFTVHGQGMFNEVKATHVGGSVFEFRIVDAGQPWVVEDSDGNVVERNRGSVHAVFLFDNGGDDEPGGDELTFEFIRVAGPHPGLERHPCEYAIELIP
jgi:hypothetical protein